MNKTFYKFLIFTSVLVTFGCEFGSIRRDGMYIYDQMQPSAMTRGGNFMYRTIRHSFTANSYANRKIERIDMTDWTSTVIAGNSAVTRTDGIGTAASFSMITDIAYHEGSPAMLYISENCFIRRMNLTTQAVTTVIGSSCGTPTNGIGTSAILGSMQALTISGNTLYAASTSAIFKIDLTTLMTTVIAGDANVGHANGTGAAARFNTILGLVVVEDTLYAIDSENSKIRSIDLISYEVKDFLGTGVSGVVDGTTNAQFNFLETNSKITSDGENFLYVTDYNSVRKIDIAKKEVTTILNPETQLDDIDGDLNQAKTFFPSGILYTPDEGLFISNFYGIRRLY